MKTVSVFGLGYVGAVTAACLAHKGHRVVGVDVNPAKVEMVESGRAPVLEPGLDQLVREGREACRLHATTDPMAAVSQSEISFICVATPSLPSGRLDVRAVQRCCEEVGRALQLKTGFHWIVLRNFTSTDYSARPIRTSLEGLWESIGSLMAAADPLHEVLDKIVGFISSIIPCDSCFIYVLEDDGLVLWLWKHSDHETVRESQTRMECGVVAVLAKHRAPIAISPRRPTTGRPRRRRTSAVPRSHRHKPGAREARRRARRHSLRPAAPRRPDAHAARPAVHKRRRRPTCCPSSVLNTKTLGQSLYSAVVGSITLRTCEILLAGKPPSRACSRTISSLGAR